MSFLGPVTAITGKLVRPHDLELHTSPVPDGARGSIERVTRIGFEVRLDVAVGSETVLVTMTRTQFQAHGLAVGTVVWVLPVAGAPTVALNRQAPVAAVS
jgi:sulfate transport system ATP-binding protein